MTGRRRWWWRLAGGLIAFGGIEGAVLLDPRPGRRAAAGARGRARGLCLGAARRRLAGRARPSGPATSSRRAGLGRLDPRTASYLRILESHLSAREVDAALRNRLRELADQTLRARHDLAVDDPRAEELLGHELRRVLSERPTKLDPEQIDRCVKRIEEL